MLEIVTSFHFMQFQEKQMNQTWENGEKPNFRPHFDSFGPSLSSWSFFREFYHSQILDIIASYNSMQFQGKLMIQTQENDKEPHFGPNLGSLDPNSSHQFFFSKIWLCQSLDIMVSSHHVQYQKKLMIQSLENLVTDGQTDRQTNRRMIMIS